MEKKFFLPLALSFGIVMVFLTPPFQVPDEPAHFFRAYQVSDFTFNPVVEGSASGGYLPESLFKLLMIFDLNNPEHDKKVTREMFHEGLALPLKKAKTTFLFFPNMAIYSPVLYIPQSTGIFIGKLFNFSPLILLYLARLFNLIFWTGIIFIAIRLIPFNKWLFAGLSLTPMAVFLAGSANADALVMGYTFVFLAFVLKIAYDPLTRLDIKSMILLCLLSVLVALSKNIYVILSLIIFIVPISKASGRKDYLLKLSVFFGFTLIGATISYFSVQSVLNKVEVIELFYGGAPFPQINPDKQIEFILSDIPGFITMVFQSFTMKADMIMQSYIGMLGWMELKFSIFYYLFALITLLFFAIVSDREILSYTIMDRLLFIFIFLGVILTFSFTMYCSWSDPGAHAIHNLQGRYFIPAMPLIWFLFQNRTLKFPARILSTILGIFAVISFAVSVQVMLDRFYL